MDSNKAKLILELPTETTKIQLRIVIGKISFLHRFIANLSGKIEAFSPLLKLKKSRVVYLGRRASTCLRQDKRVFCLIL